MKQLFLAAGLGLALTGCVTSTGWSEAPRSDGDYAVAPPVGWWGTDVASVDAFYGALSQHGVWGNHARYGRVFMPAGVGPGWQPYARGYWRQDPRFGRLWVSSEPWGWATYHYGRWGRDDRFGWFWVPDTRFGASWVHWRDGGGYSSWSPLPPPGWSSWGYGWGNDWWVHAPGAWVYQPGLYGHVRARPARLGPPGSGPPRPRQTRPRPETGGRPRAAGPALARQCPSPLHPRPGRRHRPGQAHPDPGQGRRL
jgi:hypothetical protein